MDGAEQAFGPAHLLVNNAGMIVFGSLLECQDEDWERMLSVDMYGVFVCTQVVGRRMIANDVKGTMVHIGSTASYKPAPQQFAYCVAKAGVKMISDFAAAELIQHGIRSNMVAPMGAVTDINRDLLADPAVMEALEGALPAGRLATADEIAAAAVWLCSDDAAYVSGSRSCTMRPHSRMRSGGGDEMTDLPFVDSHVHFWDLKHPTLRWVWLEPEFVHPLMGDIDGLKRLRYAADEYIGEVPVPERHQSRARAGGAGLCRPRRGDALAGGDGRPDRLPPRDRGRGVAGEA